MSIHASNRRFTGNIPFDRTPLIKMLSDSLKNEAVSFHMPGHTNGRMFSKWLHENALSIDTTELDSTDDINRPRHVVKEACSLAAKAFGAKETFFVTTGSTTAVYAALLCVSKPKDEVILFRNVHKSVMNACMMFDLTPVFATETNLADTVQKHPDACAVLITRPDYYGRCLDIKRLSGIVHDAGGILIVDEAHGTHFAFCPSYMPLPAVSNGGDIVIQSAHKTTPALTQGSYLHLSREAVQTGRVSLARVQESLSFISTSSPSFLIAATLDFARAFLEDYGEAASKELFACIQYFYSLLDPEWLPCFEQVAEKDGKMTFDPFRIVITIKNMPFTSKDVVKALSERGVQVEFYDLLRLVLICKFGNTKKDFVLLAGILNQFLNKAKSGPPPGESLSLDIRQLDLLDKKLQNTINSLPERIYPPNCGIAKKRSVLTVPLREAAQRIIFSAIVPYPPGVPLVWPGERLSTGTVYLLEALLNYGFTIYGIVDSFDEKSGEMIPFVSCIDEGICLKK